ncbi:MAG: hypothetical protein ACREXY_13310 [Gammaproteobacteria bacterium]
MQDTSNWCFNAIKGIEAFPVAVPLPQPREFAVDGLSLAILELGVRARAAKDSYGANFTGDRLRLTVDGVARATANGPADPVSVPIGRGSEVPSLPQAGEGLERT